MFPSRQAFDDLRRTCHCVAARRAPAAGFPASARPGLLPGRSFGAALVGIASFTRRGHRQSHPGEPEALQYRQVRQLSSTLVMQALEREQFPPCDPRLRRIGGVHTRSCRRHRGRLQSQKEGGAQLLQPVLHRGSKRAIPRCPETAPVMSMTARAPMSS